MPRLIWVFAGRTYHFVGFVMRRLKCSLFQESKKKEDEIEQMKAAAEKRLAEVREESLEISSHLNSAHEWFRDKFDNLQKELVNSR